MISRCVSREPSRNKMFPSRTHAPCFTSFCRLNQNTCARVRAAIAYASRIILVQHRKVVAPLILKDARLRIHVSLKRPVPVQMIGRHVQHHGNLRTKRLNRLQLKTRNFQHNHGLPRRPLRQRNRRSTNVPADQRRQSARRQNLARQRRRRSLPVRPSNRHNRPRQKLRRQFNLANHRLAHGPRLHQHRRIHRNPRTHHNQILPAKRALSVPARLDRNPMIEQRRNLIPQFISALGIGNRNPRPMRLQKQRRSHPGLAESNHQHAFVFKFHLKSGQWLVVSGQ